MRMLGHGHPTCGARPQVEYVKGWGRIGGPTTVDVSLLDGGSSSIQAKSIIIASGSEVTPLPNVPIDEKK